MGDLPYIYIYIIYMYIWENTLVYYAAPYLERIPLYIMGYRRGFQTAMLVEPLRLALLQAREWRRPIAVGRTDAEAAFESMPHGELLDGWLELGTPAVLVAAFYQQMAAANAQVVICGEASGDEDMATLIGGGRPGDVGTPSQWNVTLSFILRPLVRSWGERGFGFRIGTCALIFVAWADDFTLVAEGPVQLQQMLSELAIQFCFKISKELVLDLTGSTLK